MTSSSSSSSTNADSASLERTSRPWTDAENAAGFVLRYLVPMRDQLIQWTGNENIADESLKRLITHLVSQGFGANGKGRIRDFLIRGIRSAAKSVMVDIAEDKRPAIDFATWTPDSPAWMANWRKGLLARAWRSLERVEHKDPARPIYTTLRTATEFPQEDLSMLAVRINTQSDVRVEPEMLGELLAAARASFAQMLQHEIAETLDLVDPLSVAQEIETLGLTGIFAVGKR
jgi:hypothetical protein